MNLTAEQVRETVLKRGNVMGPRFYGDWQAIADELNLNGTVNGTANGTPTGHVPTDDGTVPIDALNAERGTCSNTVEKIPGEMPRLHCSNCNAITTLDIPDQMAESYMAWPKFCASCGARVTEVD